MAQYPATIDVSTLDASEGFRIDGGDHFRSGNSVSAADLNGDGYSDLIVGAYQASPNGSQSGSAFVVFGGLAGDGSAVDLTALDPSEGFRIDGESLNATLGKSVAAAGDVNGDGIADLIVGAYGGSGGAAGAAYVVFGTTAGFDATISPSDLNGSNGFSIAGAGGGAGFSVSSAGDINGDGVDDLIVGTVQGGGDSFVVFGHTDSFSAGGVDLAGLDGSDGFRIHGASPTDYAGRAVASAGDVNGDGFDDLIVGAPFAGSGDGAAYVVLGKADGFGPSLDLSSLDGTNGFKLEDAGGNGEFGKSVASAGDVNGDGFDDLIVGAPVSPTGERGAAYVIFGKAGGFTAATDVAALDGHDGFVIHGLNFSDRLGGAVASAGDVNGDGFDDLIIGVSRHGSGYGEAFVVFGHAGGFDASFDLSGLDGSNGFVVTDPLPEALGFSVAAAGDVNGDGLADLIIGAYGAVHGGASSGSSYVIYGRLPDAAVTRVGSAADQHILGGDFGDRLEGRGGDDLLTGNGAADGLYGNTGDDTLQGGAGDDRMQAADGNDVLIGGSGRDVMTGGAGNDLFVFSAGDSADGDRDHIRDFTSGQDRIDLHLIDADTTTGGDQAFHLGSGPRFTGNAGELVVRHVGGDTVVLGDVDGDGDSDFAVVLNGSHTLTGADFML